MHREVSAHDDCRETHMLWLRFGKTNEWAGLRSTGHCYCALAGAAFFVKMMAQGVDVEVMLPAICLLCLAALTVIVNKVRRFCVHSFSLGKVRNEYRTYLGICKYGVYRRLTYI